MSKYKAVIFDLDGTLLDTLEDLADSVNYVLDKFGYPLMDKKTVRSFLGNGIRKLMDLSLPAGLTEEQKDAAFAVFKTYYIDHCQIKTKPYDGMVDLLKTLSEEGYKLAIVSNKTYLAVKELNDTHFSKYVRTAIGEKPGIRKKPAPDTVLKALEILGCKREETIYVGDSEVDKSTADNVPMDCILVSWGFRDKPQLTALHAKYLVDSPQEILKCL